MDIDKNRFVIALNLAAELARAHETAANQTSNQKKSDAHKAAARDLQKLVDELANASTQPVFVKTQHAFKAALNNQIS